MALFYKKYFNFIIPEKALFSFDLNLSYFEIEVTCEGIRKIVTAEDLSLSKFLARNLNKINLGTFKANKPVLIRYRCVSKNNNKSAWKEIHETSRLIYISPKLKNVYSGNIVKVDYSITDNFVNLSILEDHLSKEIIQECSFYWCFSRINYEQSDLSVDGFGEDSVFRTDNSSIAVRAYGDFYGYVWLVNENDSYSIVYRLIDSENDSFLFQIPEEFFNEDSPVAVLDVTKDDENGDESVCDCEYDIKKIYLRLNKLENISDELLALKVERGNKVLKAREF